MEHEASPRVGLCAAHSWETLTLPRMITPVKRVKRCTLGELGDLKMANLHASTIIFSQSACTFVGSVSVTALRGKASSVKALVGEGFPQVSQL